ncbi:MAG: exodeoxyribonuclease VII small subunit [Candidatus Weimeria sp.]
MDEKKELTIEESLSKLDQIAAQMESPEVSLEDSFGLYEQGMKLIRSATRRIEDVQRKVEKLEADGSVSDFEDTAADGSVNYHGDVSSDDPSGDWDGGSDVLPFE